jgi:hypothetical protein
MLILLVSFRIHPIPLQNEEIGKTVKFCAVILIHRYPYPLITHVGAVALG